MPHLLSKIFIFFIVCWVSAVSADPGEIGNDFYLDKTKVVEQQIELLKNRLNRANDEFSNLQNQQSKQMASLSLDRVNKDWLNWTKLDIDSAKSNLDSISIEISESQQTISFLEKDTQEVENQLNVYDVFGMNVARGGVPNLKNMRSQLTYQKDLLVREKNRLDYLQKLQKVSEKILQIHTVRFQRIENLLKSQTMMQLKEQQAKSEIDYQEQQNIWLHRLNLLNAQAKKLEHAPHKDKAAYMKLSNEIFYANENVNFMYLQMLIARYQDQIAQLKLAISRSTSITLLNKVSEQTQSLFKQFARINSLLSARLNILENRKLFLTQQKISTLNVDKELDGLSHQYHKTTETVNQLSDDLSQLRKTLEQSLQQELSARQGLVGFGLKAWLDLGSEIILLPTLTFQMMKSLSQSVMKILTQGSFMWWLFLIMCETLWAGLIYSFYRLCLKVTSKMTHPSNKVNLKWFFAKFFHRQIWDIAIIGNTYWFLLYCHIPGQQFYFLLNIGLVWLVTKSLMTMARLSLVETMQDHAGHDVRLYYRLKWTFLIGGFITMLTVFLHQLPLVYEIKDLFYRLFLLFVAIISIFLLKSWHVLPGLILIHIDENKNYLRKIIRLLGLLLPLVLLVNSMIGVFGFLNFVLTISWYESIFLLILIGYLILRGMLRDIMEFASRLLIRHINNGWLWTEAFLKPVDNVLRIILFLSAWVILFFFYGWDKQSPVVDRLNKLMHYELINILNTSITLLSVIELVVISSLLYWAARWTREFVYRFLMSRTKDLGIRNSIAILSQYTMISIGILIGLRVMGIDLHALTVVAGAFAFGVGLGLRDLANNFACGFLLLLERPIRVGDTVAISGYEGDVMHIGGRAVTIRTWDHMEVLVPNAEIFSKSFINWTAKDHIVRSVATVRIHRHDSPHQVQLLIYQTLANHKDVLGDPIPEVFLKELANELMEFEVRYYINLRNVKSRMGVRSEVLMAIWEVFEKHGIKPPYPHHEILIQNPGLLPSGNSNSA
jgi:potassium efflux system protein